LINTYFCTVLPFFRTESLTLKQRLLQAQVIGNYQGLGYDFPRPQQNPFQNLEQTSAVENSISSRQFQPSSLQDVVAFYRKNLHTHMQQALNITNQSPGEEFLKKVEYCSKIVSVCNVLSKYAVPCFLDCMIGSHPIMKNKMAVIDTVLQSLCRPINTVFVSLVDELNVDNFPHFRQFVTMLNSVSIELSGLASLASESAFHSIIEHVNTVFLPFRAVHLELKSKMKQVFSQNDIMTQSNPACYLSKLI